MCGGGDGGGGVTCGAGKLIGGAAMVQIPNPPLHSVAFLVHPGHAQHIGARAAVRVLLARREEPTEFDEKLFSITPPESDEKLLGTNLFDFGEACGVGSL